MVENDLNLSREIIPAPNQAENLDQLKGLQLIVTITAGRIAALAIFCATTDQSQPGLHDRGRGT